MRDYLPVPSPEEVAELRSLYDQKSADLIGRSVVAVSYWDIHNYGDEPRTWDYGDWHHAVMGVDLATDRGAVSILWTDTFFPYGVEAFQLPMAEHLELRPEGPESWEVSDEEQWRSRRNSPVQGVTTFWEHIEVGPGHRVGDHEQVSDAQSYDVPVGLRLDFKVGPVWFVAGQPNWPNVDDVFVPGDEIMVVFSRERMLKIGFPDDAFVAAPTSP